MAKNLNYVPFQNKCTYHRETRRTDEDWENYLWNLSKSVGDACDKFLKSRGIISEPFMERNPKPYGVMGKDHEIDANRPNKPIARTSPPQAGA